MQVHLTGGDAKQFAKLFLDSHVDELLLFKGMKNIMKKADLC
jgi:pantothenate kinase type III